MRYNHSGQSSALLRRRIASSGVVSGRGVSVSLKINPTKPLDYASALRYSSDMSEITLTKLKCQRCGHEWYQRPSSAKLPDTCPNPKCRTYQWNKPREVKS